MTIIIVESFRKYKLCIFTNLPASPKTLLDVIPELFFTMNYGVKNSCKNISKPDTFICQGYIQLEKISTLIIADNVSFVMCHLS